MAHVLNMTRSYNEQLHIFKQMEIERQRRLLDELIRRAMLRPLG